MRSRLVTSNVPLRGQSSAVIPCMERDERGMAPLWFASNPTQQVNRAGPQPPGVRMYAAADASRIPGNVPPQMPPFQGPMPHMRGHLQHSGSHGLPRRAPPFPPRGGSMQHTTQGKGQPFAVHGSASMRLPHFRNVDRPRHLQVQPDLRGRMPFPPPRIHRPMPPVHHSAAVMQGVHRGMPHNHTARPHNTMRTRMGPQSMPHHAPMRAPHSSAAHQPISQEPLRELQNQNICKGATPTIQKIPLNPGVISRAQDAAADAAEILLGLRAVPSPPPPLTEKSDVRLETPSLDSLPDEPLSLPSRLCVPEDEAKLNSMHCFLRSDLLELFVVETSKSPKTTRDSPSNDDILHNVGYRVGSASGRVGLRCVHCAKARLQNGCSEGEAPMAVFYPKSISELYRLVTSWQRVHLRKCRNLPPSVRERYEETRQDKSRGKTQWWVTSAEQIGLVDCTSKAGGIRFAVAPNGLSI